MVVFHQSASKRRITEFFRTYLDWTVAHDRYSFSIFSMDAILTTMYFAVSIFMTVYYLATIDYLQEHANGRKDLPKVIRLLKARAGITIAMSYICLCAFYWLTKRLLILPGSPALLTTEIDRKYEIYIRMYAIIIIVAILRIASFILACPKWYPEEILKVRVPYDAFVSKPLVNERENNKSDFIVGDIIIYFWGWSFLFLTTASIALSAFLFSSDFVAFLTDPGNRLRRTKYEIFDLVFFTATQPFWTTFDMVLLLVEVFECLFMCIFEIALCRKPQPISCDDCSERHIMSKIRSPRYYNEPKLSATYYWAGRAWYKTIRLIKQSWHIIKTSVLGMWFSAKWWGMKVRWGIKLRKSRASGMTVILGPHEPATVLCGETGDGGREVSEGVSIGWWSRRPQNDDIELGEVSGREQNPDV